jgi:hypothetical protein
MKGQKVVLMGMLTVVLAFGLMVAGCSSDSGGGTTTDDGGNPFLGIWTGTVTGLGQAAQGTISVSSSGWGISIPLAGMSGAGTYTYSGTVATLKDEANDAIGTATVSGSNLTVSITSGPYAGLRGSFSK